MEQVFSTVKTVLRDRHIDTAAKRALVLAAWPEAAGDMLRNRTRAVEFADGRMVVEVQDATWKKNLEYLAPQILGKLSRLVQTAPVDFIEFKVVRSSTERTRAPAGNYPETGALPDKLKRAADSISDSSLREKFLAAAAAYLGKD